MPQTLNNTATIPNPYIVNCLASVFSFPNLQGLLTLKIPFLRLYRGIHQSPCHSVILCNMLIFYGCLKHWYLYVILHSVTYLKTFNTVRPLNLMSHLFLKHPCNALALICLNLTMLVCFSTYEIRVSCIWKFLTIMNCNSNPNFKLWHNNTWISRRHKFLP